VKGNTSIGMIQIAHVGFNKPRWIEGNFKLKNAFEFEFSWNNISRIFKKLSVEQENPTSKYSYQFEHDDVLFLNE
jgi:hypothetical protein